MAGGNDLNDMFELCSPDQDGYILTESLVGKLAEQLDGNDVMTLKTALDPKSEGKISFRQFTSAITSMTDNGCLLGQSSEHIHPEMSNLPDNYKFQPHPPVAENNVCKDHSRASSVNLTKDDYGSSSEPESTYNEYDLPDGDDTVQSIYTDNVANFKSSGCLNKPQYCSCEEHFCTPSFEVQHITIPKRHRNLKPHRSPNGFRHDLSTVLDDGNVVDESGSMTSDIEELSERVDLLKNHVAKLTEERKLQIQYETVNRENQQLVLRNHELEERIVNLTEKLEVTKKSHENEVNMLVTKHARENQLIEEVLQGKLEALKKENENLLGEMNELKSIMKRVQEENGLMRSKTESLTNQVLQMNEEYMRLNKQSCAQREKYDEEISLLQGANEKMRMELEEVTSEKSCDEGFLNEDCPPSSTAFLSAKLSNLEIENERLKCANDDLNVQLARNITDARALMGSSSENSIASEMLSATRDEVVETLKKKEAENIQLKAYLDKIILSVLEKDPSILEIK